MPSTASSAPAGSGAAVACGGGIGGTSAAAEARWLSSVRPISPLVTAAAPTPTAAPRKRRRSKSIIRGACFAARRGQAQQPTQRPGADRDGHRRRDERQHRVEQRIQHGGQQGEQAQRPEGDTAGDQRAARQQPDPRRQDERADHHRNAEHRLSFVPNRSTTNCLASGWLQRDQQRADRQHRRRRAGHQAGDQLRHAEPERAGQHAAQGSRWA